MNSETQNRNTAKKSHEKVIIVGIQVPHQTASDSEISLEELNALVVSAGGIVVESVRCHLENIHPSTFIGRGKVNETLAKTQKHGADLVVFDEQLTPAQQKNLENVIETRVLDRTSVILDIFASRAQTKEGKIQVELAQLEYILPRLTRMWKHLSRLGAGIGTRGPGETQLELDRRRIRQRIVKLKAELEKVKKRRALQRQGRQKSGFITGAIVGYTNAGKSSLLNRLTGSEVVIMDQLFATLDPTIRFLETSSHHKILLSDTVGFISKLPHQLVAAFRATLEEVINADLILHVIDASSENRDKQIQEVHRVLKQLGVEDKPMIMVYNKIDKLREFPDTFLTLNNDSKHSVAISALTGAGIESLISKLEEYVSSQFIVGIFKIPYKETQLIAKIRREGEILEIHYGETEIEFKAKLRNELFNKLCHFSVRNGAVR